VLRSAVVVSDMPNPCVLVFLSFRRKKLSRSARAEQHRGGRVPGDERAALERMTKDNG